MDIPAAPPSSGVIARLHPRSSLDGRGRRVLKDHIARGEAATLVFADLDRFEAIVRARGEPAGAALLAAPGKAGLSPPA